MKTLQALSLCALVLCGGQAFGQIRQQRPGGFGGRTPFRTTFALAWAMPISDPVKLIEMGQVTDNKRISLLMLVGGMDVSDYRRRLLITHWAGGQFVVDETKEFAGTTIDSLLVGRFRQDIPQTQVPATPPPAVNANGKPAKAPPKRKPVPPATLQQIVTTESVYNWRDGHLNRLFTAPPNTRLAMIMETAPDLVVGGQGNLAQAYVMGDTQADLFTGNPPLSGEGYVRFGVGTQDYEGWEELKMPLGLRYVQSYWNGQNRWMIAIQHPQNTPSGSTPSDRLVVLTPRTGKSDLDFWAAKPADMEDTWRSDPFPGRILDVRIGDPRNEGKDGILVLTSEKNDKERHLYFYRPLQVPAGS